MSSGIHNRFGAISLPAAIERYFEVALYLLILTGFGTIASTGALDSPTVVLVGAALLFRGYLLVQRRVWMIPETWTSVLTLVYVAYYLADYFLISGSFLTATVHLVLFVMVVRMFSARRDRDHYFLAVITFLMVLAAAVLTVDSTFLLAFAGFMLMAVITFILMEMRNAAGKAKVKSRESSDALAHRHMAFSLAGSAPVLVLFILMGAAGIFFLLPRVSTGYLSAYAAGGELATGFSDRVQLGQIGQIQQSSAVVMHIEIEGDHQGEFDLKWRGISLSEFDGRTWSNRRQQTMANRLPDGGGFKLWQPGNQSALSTSVNYHVLMEPVGTNVFFLAHTPKVLKGNYSPVYTDEGEAVYDLDGRHPISRYEATSVLPDATATGLRAASSDYPEELLNMNTQLPPLDPRIPQLAAQITSPFSNNYDKAVALENYLRTHFSYTLQLSRTPPADPLANFLFERKQGHCEYFASAMAVMLRTQGIPTRVVNGFRTGEFNDLTSQYVIRASDAHSWVEVYFPGYGWTSFDPTPAGPPQAHTGWSRAMLYLDAMASFWREWVVNYDASHQQTLGQDVARKGRYLFDDVRAWARRHYEQSLATARRMQKNIAQAPSRWSLGAILATAVLALAANARRLWRIIARRRLAAHPESSPRLAASIWYERMVRRTARQGWRKSPSQTPIEFLTCIEDEAMRKRVEEFTAHYERARFGDSAPDAQRLPELFEEISDAGHR